MAWCCHPLKRAPKLFTIPIPALKRWAREKVNPIQGSVARLPLATFCHALGLPKLVSADVFLYRPLKRALKLFHDSDPSAKALGYTKGWLDRSNFVPQPNHLPKERE